jgi:tetrahydromethanopterin S-methyltransferase subunit G
MHDICTREMRMGRRSDRDLGIAFFILVVGLLIALFS